MGIKSKTIRIIKFIFGIKEKEIFFTKDHFKNEKYVIGDFSYGKPTVYFENNDANLVIGKYCSIANEVQIFLGGNHRTDWISTYPFNHLPEFFPESNHITGHPSTKGDVIIGNDVWIGFGVTIMSGVTIANGAIIGAKSVVTKNVGPYEIWAGNPSRFIKFRFDEDTIIKLNELEWWNWEIEKINNASHVLCSPYTEILKYAKQ